VQGLARDEPFPAPRVYALRWRAPVMRVTEPTWGVKKSLPSQTRSGPHTSAQARLAAAGIAFAVTCVTGKISRPSGRASLRHASRTKTPNEHRCLLKRALRWDCPVTKRGAIKRRTLSYVTRRRSLRSGLLLCDDPFQPRDVF